MTDAERLAAIRDRVARIKGADMSTAQEDREWLLAENDRLSAALAAPQGAGELPEPVVKVVQRLLADEGITGHSHESERRIALAAVLAAQMVLVESELFAAREKMRRGVITPERAAAPVPADDGGKK